MNTIDFISRWNALVNQERVKAEAAGVPEVADDLLLVTAPRAIFDNHSFPSNAARFLVDVGLPGSCAPYLSFNDVARGPLSLVVHYGPHQFSAADAARLSQFYVIGSDGAGNPLCVDTSLTGEVVMLDHEDGFRTRTFVASSVMTLAEALLLVQTIPHSEFADRLRGFDPRAAEDRAFLPVEVGMLSENDDA
jgi:hypothetical protein